MVLYAILSLRGPVKQPRYSVICPVYLYYSRLDMQRDAEIQTSSGRPRLNCAEGVFSAKKKLRKIK